MGPRAKAPPASKRLLVDENDEPMAFYLYGDIPGSEEVAEAIREHGGTVAETAHAMAMVLVDPKDKSLAPWRKGEKVAVRDCYDYHYVLDSIDRKELIEKQNEKRKYVVVYRNKQELRVAEPAAAAAAPPPARSPPAGSEAAAHAAAALVSQLAPGELAGDVDGTDGDRYDPLVPELPRRAPWRKPTHRLYTPVEDRAILDFQAQNPNLGVTGTILYRRLERTGMLPGRTWQSLHTRGRRLFKERLRAGDSGADVDMSGATTQAQRDMMRRTAEEAARKRAQDPTGHHVLDARDVQLLVDLGVVDEGSRPVPPAREEDQDGEDEDEDVGEEEGRVGDESDDDETDDDDGEQLHEEEEEEEGESAESSDESAGPSSLASSPPSSDETMVSDSSDEDSEPNRRVRRGARVVRGKPTPVQRRVGKRALRQPPVGPAPKRAKLGGGSEALKKVVMTLAASAGVSAAVAKDALKRAGGRFKEALGILTENNSD